MAADDSLALLSLPAAAVERASRLAVRDALQYFAPDLVAIPGARTARTHATVRDLAPERPVLHPQLGRGGDRVRHYRYAPAIGVQETAGAPPAEAIDVLAVQHRDVLPELRGRLAAGERPTSEGAATLLFLPRLAVDWNATALSTTLPNAAELAAIADLLPEPVSVLAGGQPATYHHEWSLSREDDTEETVRLPTVGLGATDDGDSKLARYTCTQNGSVAAQAVDADRFGLGALHGVGPAIAERLRDAGPRTVEEVRELGVDELTALPGIGRTTAERIRDHAAVIDSGEPLVLTNDDPVRSRDGRAPLCLDIETDGLSPTIIWQLGVYDPETDAYRAFVEHEEPTNPKPVLEAFVTWLLANHADRTLLTWNGNRFDYRHIERFLRRHLPEYADAWDDVRTADLYAWAVRDENALLPGRTNRLNDVARALGYDAAGTGLSGAQTAAAYREFMRTPDDPEREPDWDRHEAYCEDDCRALWHVFRAIEDAPRKDRNATVGETGETTGRQTGLTDFST
ncbi:ribonuclease H-like domain-containing protein [Natronococcus occultus]|uniref:Helix-hairpin-helix motif protein n=1 Tax=Natronococcus occultus SP4 TaxID=694430 RepID=L0K3V6_9EURY|nr:ribonuclease H-like domain-containing protein [Natronococcus occultus]AGB39967.1 helix-hairpin-helix motif protein [Natronococcus occultus SP4]